MDGKDFDDWVQAVQNTLQLNDRGQQCLTLLRQLCVFVSVTKYSRKYVSPPLPPDAALSNSWIHFSLAPTLYALLQNVVLEPEQGPPRIRLMASCILRELCPSDSIAVKDFNPPVEESNIPYMLPVLLAQVWKGYLGIALSHDYHVIITWLSFGQTNGRGRISQLALEIFRWVLCGAVGVWLSILLTRWLTETGYEEELCLAALSSLYAICSHKRALEKFSEGMSQRQRVRGEGGRRQMVIKFIYMRMDWAMWMSFLKNDFNRILNFMCIVFQIFQMKCSSSNLVQELQWHHYNNTIRYNYPLLRERGEQGLMKGRVREREGKK